MIFFTILPLTLGLAAQTSYASAIERTTSPCSNIPKPHVPGAEVLAITSRIIKNGTVGAAQPTLTHDVHGINVCEVNVTLSHPEIKDSVFVQTWLPLYTWNNRFAAIGGGAWLAGQGTIDLALPASLGYAVSSTDAGLTDATPLSPAGWALKKDGTVNNGLLTNFASRSIHDMAIVGKAVTASFYGRKARHAYWNGCSTGGRQGLVAAQQYPDDFNGILAGAPAIYWTQYVVAELWPEVVMKEAGYYPLHCEFDAILQSAVAACDKKDHVQDGVITNPFTCHFDPFTTVGTQAKCKDGNITITAKTASIVRKIWDGPKTSHGTKLWTGMPIGASLDALADTQLINGTAENGPYPFFLPETWIQYFVKQNPAFDVTAINTAEFANIFAASKTKYDKLIGSANPDLSAFKRSGGKLLVWHGLADQLIYPQDSVKYLKEVEQKLGGEDATSNFFRLFLAPGVDHCAYGTPAGAVPVDPFAALVSWVENGTAPETLLAETKIGAPAHFTRKICRYPLIAKYRGCGDPNVAESYSCV